MNPRAAINDLLPFQGSPFGQLGYFSKLPYAIALVYFFTRSVLYYIALFFFCQELFSDFFKIFFILNKRREWDSNPRALADKRFSRPPRYDHFDISPYSLFSVFCASLSAQDIFYHRMFLLSTPNFTFFIFFQKSFCNIEIFWCCDLDILVGAFYQADLGAFFLLYYHGIIGDS